MAAVAISLVAVETRGAPQLTAELNQLASAAASASPELVGMLSHELGSTPEQAAGAAGALLGVARSRLDDREFDQVATAVPGIDSLLTLAPLLTGGGSFGSSGSASTDGPLGGLSQVAGAATTALALTSAFNKLGLPPETVTRAIPILTTFVSTSGGASVANLLASALR